MNEHQQNVKTALPASLPLILTNYDINLPPFITQILLGIKQNIVFQISTKKNVKNNNKILIL